MSQETKPSQPSVHSKPSILPYSVPALVQALLDFPSVFMIWGDVGTGKTTLALQMAKTVLNKPNGKIFYLYTKQAQIHELAIRFLNEADIQRTEQIVFWQIDTFAEQRETILGWHLQIQQLQTYFQENRVKIVFIDEIMSPYLVSMGKEEENKSLNQDLILMLATLSQICQSYRIPIILLNTFALKLAETAEEGVIVPHGGKIIDYWVDGDLTIARTAQVSRMKFNLNKNRKKLPIPKVWHWKLTSTGFN